MYVPSAGSVVARPLRNISHSRDSRYTGISLRLQFEYTAYLRMGKREMQPQARAIDMRLSLPVVNASTRNKIGLQEEEREHGQGKWEGKQKGKSDKRITESKAQQKEALHCAQT
jgi:hypothetical protein